MVKEKLRFDVGTWPDGQRYLKHCCVCQNPREDIEVREAIAILVSAFKLKVSSAICPDCEVAEIEKMDAYFKEHGV